MENYTKGKTVEEALERNNIPLPFIPENFLWMQVHGGSKMRNLLSHAMGVLTDGSSRAVVWTGCGAGLGKAISCAEIMKRELKIEHQISGISYRKTEEFWEPKLDGLEQIIVDREVPTIHILLSLDEISPTPLGYQSSKIKCFWESREQHRKPNNQPKTRPRRPRSRRNEDILIPP